MLPAVLRARPAPIPPLLLPPAAPARPLLLHLCRLRLPPAPMASSRADAAAKMPDTPPPAVAPEPPEKPLPGDCCGSGCARCVWDVYYEELEDYQKALATHAASSSPDPGADKASSTDDKAKS